MRSFLCENLCSESFPYFDRKFIECRDSGDKGDPGWPCDSEIKLFSGPSIGNISDANRTAGRALRRSGGVCRACTQASVTQCLREDVAARHFSAKTAFSMKPRKSEAHRQARYRH